MLSSLMQELAKEWELEQGLPEETPGVYKIPLDEGVSLTLTKAGGTHGENLTLTSTIASIPKGKEEILFEQALLGNLFGQGTKHAVLGLNDSGNLLTLSQCIDYDITFQDFRNIIEDFINTMDFWRQEVLKYQ